MIRTVKKSNFQVDHRITGKNAIFRGFFYTLFNGADIFLWNGTADDLVLEHNAAAALTRLHGKYNMAVLTLATGLFGVFEIDFLDGPGDRFAISNPGGADIGLHLELAQEAVNDNVEV